MNFLSAKGTLIRKPWVKQHSVAQPWVWSAQDTTSPKRGDAKYRITPLAFHGVTPRSPGLRFATPRANLATIRLGLTQPTVARQTVCFDQALLSVRSKKAQLHNSRFGLRITTKKPDGEVRRAHASIGNQPNVCRYRRRLANNPSIAKTPKLSDEGSGTAATGRGPCS